MVEAKLSQDRGFLTLAFGGERYHRMASDLLLSARRHEKESRNTFAVVTDCPHRFVGLADIVVPFEPNYGPGVSQKLFLDKYSPFRETLFVDSDCLFYADPEVLWSGFDDAPDFGVPGWRYLTRDDSHFSIADLNRFLDCVGIQRMGSFNGGIYFFRSSSLATNVFEEARAVYAKRDVLGLHAFKNSPINDEVAFAVAMEKCGVEFMPWRDGQLMQTLMAKAKGVMFIDVLSGRSAHYKHGIRVEPILMHFNGRAQFSFLYTRERYKIRLAVRAGGFARVASSLLAVPSGIRDLASFLRRRIMSALNG